MSTRDPGNRYWRTPRGAVVVTVLAWTLVGLVMAVFGNLLARPGGFNGPAPWLWFTAGTGVGVVAVIALTTALPDREGPMSELSQAGRYPASSLLGTGVGGLAALAGEHGAHTLTWALPMTLLGVLALAGPWLTDAVSGARQQHRNDIRRSGASSSGQVTEVRTIYREHLLPTYRATVRFTDTSGTQRWFRRTTPPEVGRVEEGNLVTVHFDPAHPGRRRSISVDWGTAVAARTGTGRSRPRRGPGRLP